MAISIKDKLDLIYGGLSDEFYMPWAVKEVAMVLSLSEKKSKEYLKTLERRGWIKQKDGELWKFIKLPKKDTIQDIDEKLLEE